MASSLSEDEFQRMQLQLLELRTNNYTLDDQCKRKERELVTLRDQVEILDRDLQKANKTLTKSKKAKEFDQLMQEIEGLQRKIVSQEEEFRLQNETIMHELGSLVTVNENLERENKALKDGGAQSQRPDPKAADIQDEVRRLQAQNSALQKNLSTCQVEYEQDLCQLKQTICDLETQCVKLSGQRTAPVGAGSLDRTVEGQSDPELSEDGLDGQDLGDGFAAVESRVSSQAAGSTDKMNDNHCVSHTTTATPSIMNLNNKTQAMSARLEMTIKQLNDLRICRDTELEEKNLLKDQLSSQERMHADQIYLLQEELDKVSEKFKKKQESLVALQEEKERVYTELNLRLEETTSAKDIEIEHLKAQVLRLQEELTRGNEALKQLQDESEAKIRETDEMCRTLKGQVNAASAENNAALTDQNQRFVANMAAMEGKLAGLQQAREDLQAQLRESQRAQQETLQQLYDAQTERDRQINALQEAAKLAEKRKMLLDELAIKYQSESEQHRDTLKQLEESHCSQVDSFNTTIDDLKVKEAELEVTQQEVEETRAKVSSLENTKGWLERRLNETEETLEMTKTEFEEKVRGREDEHAEALKQMEEERLKAVQAMEDILEGVRKEKEELEESITKLKQEIQDGINAKKIHEKKGASMIKDLKRQLQAERKRAEKLQERLQELLSDSKNRQSMEELFKPIDPNDRYKGDNSSVSSWTASLSGASREMTGPTSPGADTPPSVLEQENNDLLSRIAELQQEKWNCEEKVSHLESSNAAMADDLLRKTAMIEYYAMDTRSDHTHPTGGERMTLKRVVDFVKDRGDENLKDINRKLQRMLEETLTKNMHLQKDLEMLSEEVVRLSKLNGTSPSASLPPSVFQ